MYTFFSGFFLRTYVLVSSVPFFPEFTSVWYCLIANESVGTLSSFLLLTESSSCCSVATSPAIALSTLIWSSHSGWGATSSGTLTPPIGINKAFSSPSSSVSSSVSPRLYRVLAASRSSSVFPTFTGNLFSSTFPGGGSTKSGNCSLTFGTPSNVDVDGVGTAVNVSGVGMSPSNAVIQANSYACEQIAVLLREHSLACVTPCVFFWRDLVFHPHNCRLKTHNLLAVYCFGRSAVLHL